MPFVLLDFFLALAAAVMVPAIAAVTPRAGMTVLSVLSCIGCEAWLRRNEERRADQTPSRKAEMGRKRLPHQPEASMGIPGR
jgi:hypothetical protein